MAIKSRKAKIGNRCFYITVNGKDYILDAGNRTATKGLEGFTDEFGDYVIVDNEKYYIYLQSKSELNIFNKKEKTNNIDVLVFDGVNYKKKSISGDLESFQRLVDGNIESPFLATNIDKASIYWTINEEGAYSHPVTLLLINIDGAIVGRVHGNIVFSRVDSEGKSKGLSEMDIKYIKKQFKLTLHRDVQTGNLLYCILTGVE